ncbi:hypothetical protein IC615_27340 [Serratia ureilytica]
MLIYSLLHLTGYDLPMRELKTSVSCTPKPQATRVRLHPGVETATSPLGQGIANVGFAIAERTLAAAQFNRPGHDIVDHHLLRLHGRRLHDGRHLARSLLPGRHPQARQADRLLR